MQGLGGMLMMEYDAWSTCGGYRPRGPRLLRNRVCYQSAPRMEVVDIWSHDFHLVLLLLLLFILSFEDCFS